MKENLSKLLAAHPEHSNILKVRSVPGRPRLEESQPLLLKAITEIAMYGSAAHERRQAEVYRSIHTLDEMSIELQRQGFNISRSGLYIRLLPRRSHSNEGKRHVVTVPVKLIRAQNDSHSKHIDGRFCTATIHALEELSSLLGPTEVCFISQDDKARIGIGITAAQEQAPMVMHLEYKVSLPDHDWVVAGRHKLIPSVYGGITFKPNLFGKPEIGYSGPTYVGIRSGKHSSSTAFSHGLDVERLLQIPEFDGTTKHNGKVKPVFVFTVDGGPDENPRYGKTIDVHHFIKNDLDAMFIGSNAPGRSAYNRIERRMAPLSRDNYGSHLNSKLETVDEILERNN